MSGCVKFQELISRMIDYDLSTEEQTLLAEHLRTCRDCRTIHAAFSALSFDLSSDLEEPPEALRENVMAHIRRSELRLEEPFRLPAESAEVYRPAQIKKKSSRSVSPYRGFVSVAASLALVIGASLLAAPLLRMGSGTAVSGGGAADKAMSPAAFQSVNGGEEAVIQMEAVWEDAEPQDRALPMAEEAMEDSGAAPEYETEAPAAVPLPQPSTAPYMDFDKIAGNKQSGSTSADTGVSFSIAVPAGDTAGAGEPGVVGSYVELWDEGRQAELLTLLKGTFQTMSVPKEDGSTVEEEDLAAFLVYVLSLDEDGERQISIYIEDNRVYYLDTADGILRSAVCSPEKLAEFIF